MDIFKSAVSPAKRFAAFFEDDGETGWFYLLDQALPEGGQVVNAQHIYDGDHGIRPRDVNVQWSKDSRRVELWMKGRVRGSFQVDPASM